MTCKTCTVIATSNIIVYLIFDMSTQSSGPYLAKMIFMIFVVTDIGVHDRSMYTTAWALTHVILWNKIVFGFLNMTVCDKRII